MEYFYLQRNKHINDFPLSNYLPPSRQHITFTSTSPPCQLMSAFGLPLPPYLAYVIYEQPLKQMETYTKPLDKYWLGGKCLQKGEIWITKLSFKWAFWVLEGQVWPPNNCNYFFIFFILNIYTNESSHPIWLW